MRVEHGKSIGHLARPASGQILHRCELGRIAAGRRRGRFELTNREQQQPRALALRRPLLGKLTDSSQIGFQPGDTLSRAAFRRLDPAGHRFKIGRGNRLARFQRDNPLPEGADQIEQGLINRSSLRAAFGSSRKRPGLELVQPLFQTVKPGDQIGQGIHVRIRTGSSRLRGAFGGGLRRARRFPKSADFSFQIIQTPRQSRQGIDHRLRSRGDRRGGSVGGSGGRRGNRIG